MTSQLNFSFLPSYNWDSVANSMYEAASNLKSSFEYYSGIDLNQVNGAMQVVWDKVSYYFTKEGSDSVLDQGFTILTSRNFVVLASAAVAVSVIFNGIFEKEIPVEHKPASEDKNLQKTISDLENQISFLKTIRMSEETLHKSTSLRLEGKKEELELLEAQKNELLGQIQEKKLELTSTDMAVKKLFSAHHMSEEETNRLRFEQQKEARLLKETQEQIETGRTQIAFQKTQIEKGKRQLEELLSSINANQATVSAQQEHIRLLTSNAEELRVIIEGDGGLEARKAALMSEISTISKSTSVPLTEVKKKRFFLFSGNK